MGDVISLDFRRDRPSPRRPTPPTAYLDLADPLGYLVAERLVRTLPDARLRLACGSRLTGVSEGEWSWGLAAVRAKALGIPLAPPDARPRLAEAAQLAGAQAIAAGRGTAFLLALMRLAYAGGYDVAERETLMEASAAAGLAPEATLAAAADERWWTPLDLISDALRDRGVEHLPALRVGHSLLWGEERINAYLLVGGALHGRAGAS